MFKQINAYGTYVVAETNQDTLNLVSGSNVFNAANGTDTITIDTLNDNAIDKYTRSQADTNLSANISALRFYKTFVGDQVPLAF